MELYIKTPLIEMVTRSTEKQSIQLKMEAHQPSGSFKLRGIGNMCRRAAAEGATHLVSSSGGNAGLSAAYAGRKLGIPVTVVVPKSTKPFMINKLEKQKATVIVHGEAWDEAHLFALSLCEEAHTAYIPPFDHPLIWEGHATLVDELKEECSEQPDLIILSVGGGGLLNGVVEGLIKNEWTDTHILAVETEGAASFYQSYQAKKLVHLDSIHTIATSLGAKCISSQTLEYSNDYSIKPHLVTDEAATHACVRFADEYRTIVEPACGASLSVVYDAPAFLQGYRNIVVIVCGGSAVTIDQLFHWNHTVMEAKG
ncbi:pyridoxal-phosphate dependent enzyme [Brevibacillus sp. 179-C9.3 HS]|uniref:pyridoxal-phosphate dependent enzyme n=1 Tax=unclassified Brevibacillus TaxID=2684853 RepID=UPI0039A1E0E4